jgi:hypothetical protein
LKADLTWSCRIGPVAHTLRLVSQKVRNGSVQLVMVDYGDALLADCALSCKLDALQFRQQD